MPEQLVKRIIVNLQVEGTHHWPECPIAEVEYLRLLHRHVFHIKAVKQVTHNDRDIEIIQLKHRIQNYLRKSYFDDSLRLHHFGRKSCEDIAEEVLGKFDLDYCSVLEDNENGAEVCSKNYRS